MIKKKLPLASIESPIGRSLYIIAASKAADRKEFLSGLSI